MALITVKQAWVIVQGPTSTYTHDGFPVMLTVTAEHLLTLFSLIIPPLKRVLTAKPGSIVQKDFLFDSRVKTMPLICI